MTFHFSLAPLLRLRRSLEHQSELALQAASLELARAQQELREGEACLQGSRRAARQTLQRGSHGAEMQFEAGCERVLRDYCEALRNQMVALQATRDQRTAEFQQAHGERETLESLREHEFETFRAQELRREQRELDEAYLLRLWASCLEPALSPIA